MNIDILLNLQDIYSRALLIPVIGSGISVPFGLPDWSTLIRQAAIYFSIPCSKIDEVDCFLEDNKFLEAVDVVLAQGVSELDLQQFVSDFLTSTKKKADMAVDNNYTDLAEMSRLRFMTTNYDRYMNDVAGMESFLLPELECMKVNEFALRKYDNVVIPLHGEINRPESIVLSRASYQNLYGSPDFEREFQHIRTHFTFLFMGFSFDDPYFQTMFEKMIKRFEATHYILFEHGEGRKNKEKIEQLSVEYGVESIFYDASTIGHSKAIRQLLEQIVKLKDSSVDTSSIVKLPHEKDHVMTMEEQHIVDEGRAAIKKEQLSTLYELYYDRYISADFHSHSVGYQIEIICGLSWYYGFLQENDKNRQMFEAELRNPGIQNTKDKLVFMYGQVLWNLRDYTECIAMLEENRTGDDVLIDLLTDIVKCFKRFLPERKDVSGKIPVYGNSARDDEEGQAYHFEYSKLKKRYINPDTYNLLDVEKYKNIETQQIAYYWLGITAGQLFHEHEEAIQYLHRAYELVKSMSVCDELAHNYLALAENEVRYSKNPKTHQVDMNSLLKARIHFQYVMNFSDEIARNNFYERSGFAYLRTLFLLKEYLDFNDFYDIAKDYIPKTYELDLLRAEADVAFKHTVEADLLDQLNTEDRRYIEYYCAMTRADFLDRINAREAQRIRLEIKQRALAECEKIDDSRVIPILMDTAFFLRDIVFYEQLQQEYPEQTFSDMTELGFEDELYGRIDQATCKYEMAFETYRDYYGTFQILRGFYIRNHMREKYMTLYEQVINNPPDEMFQSTGFYAEYITSEITDWHRTWNALSLYVLYYDKVQSDIRCRKELEEVLKTYCADYANFEDRILWNRYMLTKVPRYAQIEIYMSILKLYVANMHYREADEVIAEMRRKNIPVASNFDALIKVCIGKQRAGLYTHQKPFFSSSRNRLAQIENELVHNRRFHTEKFGVCGGEILISMKQLICIFHRKRQKELECFSRIYIMYAGVINLQNSLWSVEDPFLRMILYWMGRADNVVLAAPEFLSVCKYAPQKPNRDHMAEDIQMKLFCEEHPEVIRV